MSTSDRSQKVRIRHFVKEEIKSGEEFGITINGFRDGGFQSSLKIHNVQPHHFTKYYCEAQNSKGEDGLIIHLLKDIMRQKRVDLTTESKAAAAVTKEKTIFMLLLQIVVMTVVVNINVI